MALFMIHPRTPDVAQSLASTIEEVYANSHIRLPSGSWLVSATGTSKEVSDRLGISGPKSVKGNSAIVFNVSGYYGRGPSEVWEWLKEKMEAGSGV